LGNLLYNKQKRVQQQQNKKLIGISCLGDCMPDTGTDRGAMRSHTMSSGPNHPRNLQTP
jgi:hypothetical protein